ncbi:MAG: hypothetical protein KDI23_10385 [Pseudomonadales bacterium]|nr:hypothetical protein [Pseudomonadales bacterium]
MATHRGMEFWSRHVAAAGGSGLSRAAYCRRHGLGYKTFLRWVDRLGSDGAPSPAQQSLVPVSIVSGPLSDEASLSLRVASGVVLTIPRSVDARWLGELLRSLAC